MKSWLWRSQFYCLSPNLNNPIIIGYSARRFEGNLHNGDGYYFKARYWSFWLCILWQTQNNQKHLWETSTLDFFFIFHCFVFTFPFFASFATHELTLQKKRNCQNCISHRVKSGRWNFRGETILEHVWLTFRELWDVEWTWILCLKHITFVTIC